MAGGFLVRGVLVFGLLVSCGVGLFAAETTGVKTGRWPGSNVPGAPNPPDRFWVSGKLTDGEGAALEDTQVLVFSNYKVDTGPWSQLATEIGLGRADAEGSFTLLMGQGSESAVFATKPGYVMDYKILKAPDNNIDLVLKKDGRKLAGTVVNAAGEPVPNALLGVAANTREVSEFSKGPWRIGLNRGNMLKVTADAEGKFLVDDLPALPLIVWSADAGDTKTLAQLYQLSAKKSTVDLGDGDVVDYKAVIDEPMKLGARSFEQLQNDELRAQQHEALIRQTIKRHRTLEAERKSSASIEANLDAEIEEASEVSEEIESYSDRRQDEQLDRIEKLLLQNSKRLESMEERMEDSQGTSRSLGSREDRIKEHQDRIKGIIEASRARRDAGVTSGGLPGR